MVSENFLKPPQYLRYSAVDTSFQWVVIKTLYFSISKLKLAVLSNIISNLSLLKITLFKKVPTI